MKYRGFFYRLVYRCFFTFYRLFRCVDYFLKDIHVASGSYVERGVNIGRFTRVNHASHIGVCDIGAYCAIGGRLVVRSTNHCVEYLNMQDWAQVNIIESKVSVAGRGKGRVRIGNAVWIGDSVIILPGVVIGDGVVIGAGSVVTRSIPSYSIAVGNPAKVIKSRFSGEVVSILESLEWWLWDVKKIQRNKDLFEIDMQRVDPADLRERVRKIL